MGSSINGIRKVYLVKTLFVSMLQDIVVPTISTKDLTFVYKFPENKGHPRWFIEKYSSAIPQKKVCEKKETILFWALIIL